MKYRQVVLVLALAATLLGATGCVSAKRYKEVQAIAESAEAKAEEAKAEVAKLKVLLDQRSRAVDEIKKVADGLREKLLVAGREAKEARSLVKSKVAEVRRDLAVAAQRRIAQLTAKLKATEGKMASARADAARFKRQAAEMARKVHELAKKIGVAKPKPGGAGPVAPKAVPPGPPKRVPRPPGPVQR